MSVENRRTKSPKVVVVGAGIIGASIAFHLSRRGAEVVIMDRLLPGAGASGHSFAWMNSFGKEPADYHALNRRSMDMWDRFARRLDADIGIHWGGEMRWVTTSDQACELRRQVRKLQARGYASRLIDEEEMSRLEPGISLGNVAAALSDNDGHVDPLKVIQACLTQAEARGATVHTNTEATGVLMDGHGGDRARGVRSAQGEVACDVVVLAAGVRTTELAATAGVPVPQEESPGVVVRTGPMPTVLHTVSVLHVPSVDRERVEIHLRQNADGSLLIGEGTQESLARDASQEHADEILARATHYLPALAGARAIPEPVGFRPMLLDGLPVLGFARSVPNVYVALMHSSVTRAPLVGELAAMEIVDGARTELFEPYRPERFSG